MKTIFHHSIQSLFRTATLTLAVSGIFGAAALTAPAVHAAISGPANSPTTRSASKPNIILFLVDDMGWQDTSVPFWTKVTKLNKRYHTPNMKILASQGMKFTNAYANCVCSPTRVSLLTGEDEARTHVTNWIHWVNRATDGKSKTLKLPVWNYNGLSNSSKTPLSISPKTLPQVMHEGGYRTIIVGKGHFGAYGTPGSQPYHLGFDVSIASCGAGQPGSYLAQKQYGLKSGNINTVPDLDNYFGSKIFLTTAITREANYAVDRAVADHKPFFLYMAQYALHLPYAADPRYYTKYKAAGLSDTEAKYAALIEGMDTSLGKIMVNVKRLGLTKNTIIIFMSDNGGLAAHGRTPPLNVQNAPLKSGKGSAYEGGVREPMIVKWPGVVKQGTVCNTPVMITDFLPTITAMAGVPKTDLPKVLDGFSIIPLLKQTTGYPKNREIIWNYPNVWGASGPGIEPYCAIRQGDWKLIYFYPRERFELYNIPKDIGEDHNLVAQQPKIAARLANALQEKMLSEAAQRPSFKKTGQPVPWPGDAWKAQTKAGVSHAGTAPQFVVGAIEHIPLMNWGSNYPDN